MKQGTDVGCDNMNSGGESEFSVMRMQQNLKCGRVKERLQWKAVDRKEGNKLRGGAGGWE